MDLLQEILSKEILKYAEIIKLAGALMGFSYRHVMKFSEFEKKGISSSLIIQNWDEIEKRMKSVKYKNCTSVKISKTVDSVILDISVGK